MNKQSNALIDTPTSRIIRQHIKSIRDYGAAGAVLGESGIGKSHVARCLFESDPSCYLVEASEKTTTNGILKLIAECSGTYHTYHHKAAYELERQLMDQFKDTDFLLVDEAQNLSAGTIRLLLSFNDAHKGPHIPVIFLANYEFLKGSKSGESALQQVLSRIEYRMLKLGAATWKDFECIAMSHDVTGTDAYDHLKQWWEAGADLRGLMGRLRVARDCAGAGAIRLHHLMDARLRMNALDTSGQFVRDRSPTKRRIAS
jgi:hypothetical protein